MDSSNDDGERTSIMPLYDMRCKECGYEFEDQRRLLDKYPKCPNQLYDEEGVDCGGETEILLSPTPHTFKGGPPTPKNYR